MPAFRFLARLGAVLIMGVGAASAQSDYRVYIDADNDTGTGCSATLPGSGSTLDGMEARLTASRDAANQITNVTRDTCSGGGFGASVSVGGGYPVGLNNGLSGADVVELSDSLTGLGMTEGGTARFAFVAEDASGDDVLAGATGGGPILVDLPALTPSQIPGLGTTGTGLLIIVLGGLAFAVLRRRPGAAWTVVGLLVLTTAWAAHRMADGQVGDWSGDSPVGSDAVGDASNGNDAIDIVGAFLAVEGGQLYARIDVADVENATPTADAVGVSLLEDDPATPVTLSGSDPEGAALSFAIDTPPGLGSLGAVSSTGPATATVDYTPNPDANGADSFTYTVNDGAVTSAPATASVTITPVNDAPTFTASDPPAVLEDAGAQTVTGFATFDPGAANESGQSVLAYTVSNVSNPGLFSASPAVDNAGNLTYTPAAATTGTSTFDLAVRDDGGTANGGVDTSAVQTFTITVDDVNGEPSFTAGPDQNVLEDAGAQTVAGWATNIDDGDGGTQTLTFNITNNTNPALFSAGPAVDATTGDLTYTPAADANGSADITVELMDDGGTANGGDNTSAPVTFTITVDPVNDAPAFTASDPPAVLEDAGAQTVTGFASFDPGPANESGQNVLTYTVSSISNAALFSAAPSVDSTGTLTYEPAADANGTSTFDLTVQDDGGTANGGADTSPTQTFTITVDAVNDAPSFTSGGSVSSDEDAGAQSVAWATSIDDGDGGTQTLTFNVTNNTNAGLFSTPPAVDPATGNLSYTSALNANGSADVTVELMDDGGTANGGDNTSAPATFTITVNPINDPPQVTAPGPFSVTGNVRIQVPDGVDDLLAGANDAADGGTALSVTAGSIASTQGGDVTLNADGTFSYDPPAGYEGTDSFNFEVCDSGVPGSACTNATVNLNVSDMVWFVDSSASAGDGRLTSPFNDVDALDAVNDGTGNNPAAGDDIFLYTGTHDGSLTLLNTQRVFGQGATATLATLTGITLPTYSDPFPATGGTRPNWTASNATALTVAQGNTLRGFNIGDTGTGTDIAGSSFGTLTVSELDLLGSGQALDLSTGTLAGTIGAITSTSGSRNVSLVSVSGTPTFGGGSLSGATNQAFYVDGGTGSFSYAGSITNTSDRVVQIQDKSDGGVTLSGNLTSNSGGTGILVTGNNGGTYAFSGANKVINTGANPAVTLTSNTGATVNFTNGGLDIDATSGTGFSATGGGAVIVTGSSNTVNTGAGTGVNIANTTIGGSGVTFQSVSADGASNGIILNNTGTSGGFSITGDSGSTVNGSGGTLANIAGDAIQLTDTMSFSMDQLNMSSVANHGIRGIRVNGLDVRNGTFSGVGDADGEDVFSFDRDTQGDNGLVGIAVLQNLAITNFAERAIDIVNEGTGTLDLDVLDVSADNNNDTFGEDAIRVQTEGSVNADVLVSGGTYNNLELDVLAYFAQGTGSNTVEVTGVTSTNGGGLDNNPNGGGVAIIGSAGSTTSFDINANSLTGVQGAVVQIIGLAGAGQSLTMNGDVTGNTLASDNADGIDLDFDGDPGGGSAIGGTILVQNNLIDFEDDGIGVDHRDAAGTMNITIRDNTLNGIAGDDASTTDIDDGIFVFTDDDVGAAVNQLNLEMINNAINNVDSTKNVIEIVDVQNGNKVCFAATGTSISSGSGSIELDTDAAADLVVDASSASDLTSLNNGIPVVEVVTPTYDSSVNCIL